MSVQVEQLTKIYGTQKAVDNISFQVKHGDILGFLGPNGAGKSTAMKMITGYISPSAGKVSVSGIDMLKNPQEGQKAIGYLPENNPLYKEMFIKEYLHFVAGVYKLEAKKEAVKRVIEMTGLVVEQHKKIGQLSKGYRQRVGIAQALIHDPKVLILDEPMSGLDPNQLEEIRQLIRELGKDKTVIFSTHIMQEVQAICNRVMIIQNGKIVANDTVNNITQQIHGVQKIVFSMEKPIDINTFKALEIIDSIEQKGNLTYEVTGKDAYQLKKALFRIAVKTDNPILQLQDMGTNLEGIFKQLTHSSK
ncbi:MAG: gliding motility-associated ABC transporter ATP-binding subunit GldA [Chitinophagales bacterium]|nr:gliding motility-associated ABC transporter ATP-binding subunit GldA [Chitinophagales bacterium]